MPTILVVDDAAVDRRLVGGILQRNPQYLVQFAEDGREAISALRQSQPDLIVTDMQMPNRSGLELVAAVKMHYPSIPIILMTGHGSEAIALEALHAGASGYVPKTQLSECLLDAVNETLALSLSHRTYEKLVRCLSESEFDFSLDTDHALIDPLVDLVQQLLGGLRICDAASQIRAGTAVREALQNAMFRGNLQIAYAEMPDVRSIAEKGLPPKLQQRSEEQGFLQRKVHVHIEASSEQAIITIRDEGPGHDAKKSLHVAQSTNLQEGTGKGLVLITNFVSTVSISDSGSEISLTFRPD